MWLPVALVSAMLFALVTHVDKYLLTRFFKGGSIASLLIFTSLVGLPIVLIIGIFNREVFGIPWNLAGIIVANGMVYMCSLIPYFMALDRDETSRVVPLFEMVGAISLLLGWVFLKETIVLKSLIGSVIIVGGGVGLVTEFKSRGKFKIKKDVFGLMFLASLLTAVNGLIFKAVAMEESLWVTMFWEYVGFVCFALVILVGSKKYRLQFQKILKINKLLVVGVNFFNALLAAGAKISFHIVTLATAVAISFWVIDGFQQFFVLIIGIIITLVLPKIARENISKRMLVQKLGFIAVMLCGSYLLI
jgi:uncharacterized membrane protein